MDAYTLIFVRDQHARPVQIAIPKARVKQAAIGVGVTLLIGAVLAWDYWRLRADNVELAGLREHQDLLVVKLEQGRIRLQLYLNCMIARTLALPKLKGEALSKAIPKHV